MTDQEHSERIREAAEALNNAALDAIAEGLRVELEVIESRRWEREFPTQIVKTTVSRTI